MVDALSPQRTKTMSSRLRTRPDLRNRTLRDERNHVTAVWRTRSRSIAQSRSINRNRFCAKTIQPISVIVSVASWARDTLSWANGLIVGQRRKGTASSELSWPSTFILVVS